MGRLEKGARRPLPSVDDVLSDQIYIDLMEIATGDESATSNGVICLGLPWQSTGPVSRAGPP